MKVSYLETNLPRSLKEALEKFKIGQQKYLEGTYIGFDMDCDELNACINSAEVTDEISERQAWYLREKYLGLTRDD